MKLEFSLTTDTFDEKGIPPAAMSSPSDVLLPRLTHNHGTHTFTGDLSGVGHSSYTMKYLEDGGVCYCGHLVFVGSIAKLRDKLQGNGNEGDLAKGSLVIDVKGELEDGMVLQHWVVDERSGRGAFKKVKGHGGSKGDGGMITDGWLELEF